MPVFKHACGDCGREEDVFLYRLDEKPLCECGNVLTRQFSPTTNLRLAPWMRREAEDGRARHRLWLEKPETKALIKSGELDTDLSNRDGTNAEGAFASSDTNTRNEEFAPL
jgi:hypothetical protein